MVILDSRRVLALFPPSLQVPSFTHTRTWMGRQMAPQAPKVLSTMSGIPCFLARALSSVKRGMLYCWYEKENREKDIEHEHRRRERVRKM